MIEVFITTAVRDSTPAFLRNVRELPPDYTVSHPEDNTLQIYTFLYIKLEYS
jgi:hypothetical protein